VHASKRLVAIRVQLQDMRSRRAVAVASAPIVTRLTRRGADVVHAAAEDTASAMRTQRTLESATLARPALARNLLCLPIMSSRAGTAVSLLAGLIAAACSEPPPSSAQFDAQVGGHDAYEPDDRGTASCGRDGDARPSALLFDGADDHVTMGAAPALGLATFTIEAWVRRDGRGESASTGVGGLLLVPIAGKGRGEGDGSTIDCDYAFGFVGDVLGADFEDTASGLNHPIVGSTAVPLGEWHHVAAAYDGATWRLYLDGRVDAELGADATPRADSVQHFGIGAAFDSMGVPAGRLAGAVDEVRVWNRARTEAEIASTMFESLTSGDGLVARWALDEADRGAPDSVGGADGSVVGATFVTPGAAIDLGLPPVLGAATPAQDAAVSGESVEISVAIDDPDDDPFVATFYVRSITGADDFSIVVLPDTQYYTEEAGGLERFYYDQTQWIVDHRAEYGIVGAIHSGDIVDDGDRYAYEWMVASRAMGTLEEEIAGLPDGVPYAICVGNHDQTPNGTPDNTTSFNTHFGVERFAGRAYYGGHYGDDNDESWVTFSAGTLDFVVVSLQYDETPDPAVLAWARTIFESHPDAFGILSTHYVLDGDGSFSAQGRAIYDALRDVDNVQIMTGGHISAEAQRTDTFEGHVVHSILADYQRREQGGSGWMRIWTLSPAKGELAVRTYSPTLDAWETDDDSELTLAVDLSGAGGDFTELASVGASAGHAATTTWSGLVPGRIYEWYVTVSDCAHTVRSPVHRFETAP